MGFSLEDMVNKIDGYHKICNNFGFSPAGSGSRVWSVKYISSAGEVLNVRNSDWVLFDSNSSMNMVAEGKAPIELKKFLLSRLSYEDLIEYACKDR